jgi:hypothetical protein
MTAFGLFRPTPPPRFHGRGWPLAPCVLEAKRFQRRSRSLDLRLPEVPAVLIGEDRGDDVGDRPALGEPLQVGVEPQGISPVCLGGCGFPDGVEYRRDAMDLVPQLLGAGLMPTQGFCEPVDEQRGVGPFAPESAHLLFDGGFTQFTAFDAVVDEDTVSHDHEDGEDALHLRISIDEAAFFVQAA